jgi:hypothetical protein
MTRNTANLGDKHPVSAQDIPNTRKVGPNSGDGLAAEFASVLCNKLSCKPLDASRRESRPF